MGQKKKKSMEHREVEEEGDEIGQERARREGDRDKGREEGRQSREHRAQCSRHSVHSPQRTRYNAQWCSSAVLE